MKAIEIKKKYVKEAFEQIGLWIDIWIKLGTEYWFISIPLSFVATYYLWKFWPYPKMRVL